MRDEPTTRCQPRQLSAYHAGPVAGPAGHAGLRLLGPEWVSFAGSPVPIVFIDAHGGLTLPQTTARFETECARFTARCTEDRN